MLSMLALNHQWSLIVTILKSGSFEGPVMFVNVKRE